MTNQRRRQRQHRLSADIRNNMTPNPRPCGSYHHLRSPEKHSVKLTDTIATLVLLDATEQPRPIHCPRSGPLELDAVQNHPGFGHRLSTGFAMLAGENFES